jgi:ammonium transporter, Amt family
LLDYSKYVKFETIRVKPTYFSIETLLKEIHDIFKIPCHRKGIQLIVESNNLDREVIMNDKTRLIQILINLVGNSVKFTNSGHIKIEVLKISNLPFPTFQFSVSDSGIGISEE